MPRVPEPGFRLTARARQDLIDIGRHIIFYRMTGQIVEIVRVLHQSMDHRSRF